MDDWKFLLCFTQFKLNIEYLGNTGFIEAASNGHLEILEFLLTKGASIDEKNYDGKMELLYIYLILIKVKSKN